MPDDLSPAVAETHISVLFFVGDRVYKLKKPVSLGFLDFSSRAAREADSRREVELNRRFAPDVYLGVADVAMDGETCDHLVVMRRLPASRRLATLVREGADVSAGVRQVAKLLARYHAEAPAGAEIDEYATRDALLRNWEQNFQQLKPYLGSVLDAGVERRVELLARAYLAGRRPLFDARIASGFARDGHGDLLADDIYLLPDGPRVLDCLEFAERYRYGDVLLDAAFLAMDLERLGAPRLGERFLDWYDEFSGHTPPATLRHHYVAYRAHVRAKVACLGGAGGVAGARRLLGMALDHLELGEVRLLLVGGPPGTGKTTLAAALAAARGWAYLSTDEVRKDLAGLGHATAAPAGFREGVYAPDRVAATYEELLRRARACLEQGVPAVLDGTWSRAEWRRAAARLAEETGSRLAELRCEAPPEVVASRVRDRRAGPSDASIEIATRLAAGFEPWPSAKVIDTTLAPAASARDALTSLSLDGVSSEELSELIRTGP